MRITENVARSMPWRDFGTFYCEGCGGFFSLRATRSGLACCPLCGENEARVRNVHIGGSHEDNDIDDDYGF